MQIFVFLLFIASKRLPTFLSHDHLPIPKSAMTNQVFLTLHRTNTDSSTPSSMFKGPYDYMGPTQIIKDNLHILKLTD